MPVFVPLRNVSIYWFGRRLNYRIHGGHQNQYNRQQQFHFPASSVPMPMRSRPPITRLHATTRLQKSVILYIGIRSREPQLH